MYMSKLIIKKGSHTVTFSELRRGQVGRGEEKKKKARENETGEDRDPLWWRVRIVLSQMRGASSILQAV